MFGFMRRGGSEESGIELFDEAAAQTQDASKYGHLLNAVNTPIIACDPKTMMIEFINEASMRELTKLRHVLPSGVDPRQMVGVSIDVFHKHPQHQRNLLADPSRLPHEARIQLGDQWMDLRIDAVRDQGGRYFWAVLTWNIATDVVKAVDDFEREVQSVVDDVASTSQGVRSSVEDMVGQAQRSSSEITHSASEVGQATQNVEVVAAASEELASSINEISRQVSESSAMAQAAVEEAHQTHQIVEGLVQASDKIGEVVNLISEIAEQTNLLALNATIEAARAGDAGKGFAVVADEVKNLASQTAKATEEIAQQIGAIQGSTGQAATAINSIGGTIEKLCDISTGIAAAVEEQGAATQEISRNVNEAVMNNQNATRQLEGATDQVRQGESSAQGLLSMAQSLDGRATDLSQRLSAFLEQLKSL
ncbi:MAG: methyl-accepting chemotaxis protein [Bradymonadia bacterium]